MSVVKINAIEVPEEGMGSELRASLRRTNHGDEDHARL